MHIDHVALWTNQLETMKDFYTRYFGGKAGDVYENINTGFHSYFLTFDDGARLELMHMSGIIANNNTSARQSMGWIHIAFTVGDPEAVDALTETLREDGATLVGEPRWTGDGYYESVVLDPDGNRIEISAEIIEKIDENEFFKAFVFDSWQPLLVIRGYADLLEIDGTDHKRRGQQIVKIVDQYRERLKALEDFLYPPKP